MSRRERNTIVLEVHITSRTDTISIRHSTGSETM